MESFIKMCKRFSWARKIRISYKRLVTKVDDDEANREELERLLRRSVKSVIRELTPVEEVGDLDEAIDFLEMLVLNLNAANTELSEEFPDFDSRLLPLLEVYSELMVFRSQHSSTAGECMQRMASFLMGLSIHHDQDISRGERTKNLLKQLTFKVKASTSSLKKKTPPPSNLTNSLADVSLVTEGNESIIIDRSAEKRVRFDEGSPRRIEPVEWPDPCNDDSSDDMFLVSCEDEKDEAAEEKDEAKNTAERDEARRSPSPQPTTTDNSCHQVIRSPESIDDIQPDTTKAPKALEEPPVLLFELSSDDEGDSEPTTSLDSILESLASPPPSRKSPSAEEEVDIDPKPLLFVEKDDEKADSGSPICQRVRSTRRRIMSSESSSSDAVGSASLPDCLLNSTEKDDKTEANSLLSTKAPTSSHSEPDASSSEETKTAAGSTRQTSIVSQEETVNLTVEKEEEMRMETRRIIPESPLKDDPPSVRLVGVAIIPEITPITSSTGPFDLSSALPSTSTDQPAVISFNCPTVSTAKNWIVRNQAENADSPRTTAAKMRRKVRKALARPVRERRLHSCKWIVAEISKTSSDPSAVVTTSNEAIVKETAGKVSPVGATFTELKRSMEGNLLGCDASMSDAEILEEIETSVQKWSGSDEDLAGGPVEFSLEDESVIVVVNLPPAPTSSAAKDVDQISVGETDCNHSQVAETNDVNPLRSQAAKESSEPTEDTTDLKKDDGDQANAQQQQRRRSSRLAGLPVMTPLPVTKKKEPMPNAKKRRTMAPSPRPIEEDEIVKTDSSPLIPITWEEVRQQLPACWIELLDQHVKDTQQADKLHYRESCSTARLKLFCPCSSLP